MASPSLNSIVRSVENAGLLLFVRSVLGRTGSTIIRQYLILSGEYSMLDITSISGQGSILLLVENTLCLMAAPSMGRVVFYSQWMILCLVAPPSVGSILLSVENTVGSTTISGQGGKKGFFP